MSDVADVDNIHLPRIDRWAKRNWTIYLCVQAMILIVVFGIIASHKLRADSEWAKFIADKAVGKIVPAPKEEQVTPLFHVLLAASLVLGLLFTACSVRRVKGLADDIEISET